MTRAIAVEKLLQFTQQCLERVGMSSANAHEVGLALVTTDAMGVFTHGTKLLAGYLKKLRGAAMSPRQSHGSSAKGLAGRSWMGTPRWGRSAASLPFASPYERLVRPGSPM